MQSPAIWRPCGCRSACLVTMYPCLSPSAQNVGTLLRLLMFLQLTSAGLTDYEDRAFVSFEREIQRSLPAVGLAAPEVGNFAGARQFDGDGRRCVGPVEDAEQRS